MISGRHALGVIDESLNQERASIDTADTRIAEVSRQLLALQQARVEDYRELARSRVELMASGNTLSGIDAVGRQVAAALLRDQRHGVGHLHGWFDDDHGRGHDLANRGFPGKP